MYEEDVTDIGSFQDIVLLPRLALFARPDTTEQCLDPTCLPACVTTTHGIAPQVLQVKSRVSCEGTLIFSYPMARAPYLSLDAVKLAPTCVALCLDTVAENCHQERGVVQA